MKKLLSSVSVSFLAFVMIFGFQFGQAKAQSSYPSGSLVNDGGTIYLIRGTQKVPFTNWPSFVGLGYSLKNVVSGDTSGYTVSSNYVVSANAAHPWGSWVSYNRTVYYSTSSGIVGVPTPEVFTTDGGQWSYVVPANKYDLASINGSSVLADNDSRVYQTPGSISVPPVAAPVITSVTPNNGPVGTAITISGSGFSALKLYDPGSNPSPNTDGVFLTNGSVWSDQVSPTTTNIQSDNTITTTLNTGACQGPTDICSSNFSSILTPGSYSLYVVTVNGTSNEVNFTVTSSSSSTTTPTITSLSPSSGPVGMQVTITGTNFTSNGNSVINSIGGSVLASSLSSNGTSLTFTVPSQGLTPGNYNIMVTNGNGSSNASSFTLTSSTGSSNTLSASVDPSSISKTVAAGSTNVMLAKFDLMASGNEALKLMLLPLVVNITNSTQITSGYVTNLKLEDGQGNIIATTPSMTPTSVSNNYTVYFGSEQHPFSSLITLQTAENTLITLSVYGDIASNATAGSAINVSINSASNAAAGVNDNQVVAINSATANSVNIATVSNSNTPLVITSISPSSGPVGSQITITGTGFTPTGNSVINNSTGQSWVSSLSSSNGTSLTFTAPAYICEVNNSSGICSASQLPIGSGTYSFEVENGNNVFSNSVPFTVTAATAQSGLVGLNPPQFTLSIGQSVSDAITNSNPSYSGGYQITANSNSSVASASISGTTLQIQALQAGYSTISICATNGNSALGSGNATAVNITVVSSNTSYGPIVLSTNNVSLIVGQSTNINVTQQANNGSPAPVFSFGTNSNPSAISASIPGTPGVTNTLIITGNAVGSGVLQVCGATSNTANPNCANINVSITNGTNSIAALNTSAYPLTAVVGQTHQKVASFVLTAPVSDALTINALSFKFNPSTVILNNAALYINGQEITPLGFSPINTSGGATRTPALSPSIVVASGSSRVVDVYADIDPSTPAGSSLNISLNGGQATGNTSNTSYYYSGTGSMNVSVTN
jgi:hypothetical protein